MSIAAGYGNMGELQAQVRGLQRELAAIRAALEEEPSEVEARVWKWWLENGFERDTLVDVFYVGVCVHAMMQAKLKETGCR